MNSTLAEAAGDTPRPAPLPAARPRGATVITLVRREFWEHRYLWLVPLVTAVLIALCGVLGRAHMDFDADAGFKDWMRDEQRVALASIVQWVLAVPLWLVLLFLLSYYTLDCLYAERKDRSILFWKSLPVSDGLTVGSKLLVALVVAPLLVYVLAILAQLLFTGIVSVRMAVGNVPPVLKWSTIEWLRTELVMLLILILSALWYAPVAAALMLVSAWARRSPFLWATVPPVLAPLLERIAFGTHYLWDFIRYRTDGIWRTLVDGYQFRIISHHGLRPVGTLLSDLNFRGAFADRDLWLGVVAAAVLLFAAVRIRRYRDDS
jgi:ABC-2 type transport system permease protein